MIIITFNTDNSSIIYTSSDVVHSAKKYGIPVYFIAVGNAMSTYFLRYISAASGGRFYHINQEEYRQLPEILREIIYSQKIYYELDYPVATEGSDCRKIKSRISFEYKQNKFSDDIFLFPKPPVQYTQFQATALFKHKDNVILPEYDTLLKSLADVLKDNPASKIELIGNSGNEDSESFNQEISVERADAVKARLIELGISEQQIKTKGVANSRPLYYFEREPWQGMYNRRVEIRWLDPSLEPFEIIAEKVYSEEDAERKVTFWEKLKDENLKVYYDRWIENDKPVYRIKFWGYSTQQIAEAAARNLSKKYKLQLVVE